MKSEPSISDMLLHTSRVHACKYSPIEMCVKTGIKNLIDKTIREEFQTFTICQKSIYTIT